VKTSLRTLAAVSHSAALPLMLGMAVWAVCPSSAQMTTGSAIPGYAETFGLGSAQQAKDYGVEQIGVKAGATTGANVLWPKETAEFTFRLVNKSQNPIKARGKMDLIQYATKGRVGETWVPDMFKVADVGATPVEVDIPAQGTTTVTVSPRIPERFGGYALIFDLGSHGRAFGAALVRTVAATPGRVQYPTLGIDLVWPFEMTEATFAVRERLGAKAARMEVGYFPTTSPDFESRLQEVAQHLTWAQDHNMAIMLFVGAGGPQPMDHVRPWLDDEDNMLETKYDAAWLPSSDDDFQQWMKLIAGRFGWPKGPVNGVELWNEPWEGISISGWGADMPRYREIYTHMAQGIEEARKEYGVEVLIGGACSSSNTLDKFFSDGSDTFLKWLDFTSIHYQAMSAAPSLIRQFRERKSPYGPVRVWDTESWIANSDDRVAVVIASMRAQGQDRANGINGGNVFDQINYDNNRYSVGGAWSPGAALAAAQKFIGERRFKEVLFKNGLPWVFVFEGLPLGNAPNPDDGTLVIVGDLNGLYDRNQLLFRSVLGLGNLPRVMDIKKKLVALPPDASAETRRALESDLLKAQVLEGGSLILSDGGGLFTLYDFYGNPVASKGGRITVPLDGLGYFLRSNGSRGSFAKLLKAVETSRIEGYEPLDVIAHDLLAPIEQKPSLRLTLANILNRPVAGELDVKLGNLQLEPARQTLRFALHETRDVLLKVVAGQPAPDNTYPLSLTFDAGKDGQALHEEAMHVNFIAKRTITVDGSLDDWRGVLPQPATAGGVQTATLMEQAWLPFAKWEDKIGQGVASGYLAYDNDWLYFAAKIADDTPDEGTVRFETRDDDQYYYPEKCYAVQRDANGNITDRQELTWPAGVRRYSYRKNPDLPSGNFPDHDNVQMAFNVIPMDQKPWYPNPPGTMPRFICYWDTDYEYALNKVAAKYGGGTEIWRLLVPGMPRKHFYPRQPQSPFDGPVKAGRLEMRHEGNTRLVEAALPWPEMPLVKKRLDAGATVKFSFRVDDNQGPGYELAAGRSVSKVNFPAFHVDWVQHWANELEFACEK